MQNFQAKNQDQDKTRQRNELQRQIIMVESDTRKFATEKTTLEAEIRQLKKDETHIKMNLQEKQKKLEHVEYELLQIDNQLKSLKKKLNTL